MFTIHKRFNYISNFKGKCSKIIDFSSYIQLDSGGYGKIYKINDKFVLKTFRDKLSNQRNYKSDYFNKEHLDSLDFSENPWREIYIHIKANELLKKKYTQNIILMGCYNKTENNIYIIVESYNMNLYKFLEENNNNIKKQTFMNIYYNIIFQALHGFLILQEELHFYQGDPGMSNILIKKIKKGGFWKYIVNDVEYLIPNLGFIVVICDFGNALIKDFKIAKYEKEYYPQNIWQEAWYIIQDIIKTNKAPQLKTIEKYILDNILYDFYQNIFSYKNYKKIKTTDIILKDLFYEIYATTKINPTEIIDTFTWSKK
jgi:hypothetical protein